MLRFASYIDFFLNSITMYRLVLYSLIFLAGVAIVFGFTNTLSYSGKALLIQLTVLIVTCQGANYIFAKIFKATTNHESSLITSFILFFLLLPPENLRETLIVGLAGFIAMSSKYILAINKKHIFNPAAFSAFIISISGLGFALWWVGNPYMFPAVLVTGLLIVRKIRKFTLFLTFLTTSIIMMGTFGTVNNRDALDVIKVAFLSYALFFFGTVMLTEPSTLPPTKKLQVIYAAIVGVIFGSQYHIGPITSSPETALIIGNLFSYIVSFKEKAVLILEEKKQIAKGAYEFVFSTKKRFGFNPGQYMEWTLPDTGLDKRGNRRYFTISSSPTEDKLKLGVRFYPKPSKFKTKLLSFEKGARLTAGQLSGDFILPKDVNKKLVFIAGGIGITPFRSMLKFILDKGEKRQITLFCINKTEEEIPYKDFLEDAGKKLDIKIIHVLSEAQKLPDGLNGEIGHISSGIVKKYVSDYKERTFYISGSNAVVNACKYMINSIGVKYSSIVTDYFPGF